MRGLRQHCHESRGHLAAGRSKKAHAWSTVSHACEIDGVPQRPDLPRHQIGILKSPGSVENAGNVSGHGRRPIDDDTAGRLPAASPTPLHGDADFVLYHKEP